MHKFPDFVYGVVILWLNMKLIATKFLNATLLLLLNSKNPPIWWNLKKIGNEFSLTQVDRAPALCSGGHMVESWRGLRFFLCPTPVAW